MPEPTLSEVFGSLATQDGGGLIINKADLALRGLTPDGANTAESMFVAILLNAANSLTEANRITDLPNRNVSVSYSGQDLIDQGGGNVFLRDTFQVSFYKSTAIQQIDPDNY